MAHDEALSIVSMPDSQVDALSITTPTLTCQLEYIRPDYCHAKISIPTPIVNAIYHEAARTQQGTTQTYGFHHGHVPIEYIKQNFKENLVDHLKELFS